MAQNVEPLGTVGAKPEIIETPDPPPAEDYEVGLKSLNQWQLAWRKFRKHRLALIGLGIIAALIVRRGHRAVPDAVQLHRHPAPGRDRRSDRPAAVASQHPMGETGGLQRDVLTLVVNGARTSLADRLLEHGDRRVHRHDRRAPSPASRAASWTTS